jgi:hypothetical protein
MYVLLKFLLLSGLGLGLVVLFASGAIGVFIYFVSNGYSHTETPVISIPRWEDVPKVSKEELILYCLILVPIWILVGCGDTTKIDDDKDDFKKGRNRKRYSDKD